MFKPYKGICQGKPGKIEGCGKPGIITTNSRRLCQQCEAKRKPQKAIPKASAKGKINREKDEDYYRKAIAAAIVRTKGNLKCENCKVPIEEPTGMNVSHILPKSTHPELYHHPENHKILCKVGDDKDDWGKSCHQTWETGEREKMPIYAEIMFIREKLLDSLVVDI